MSYIIDTYANHESSDTYGGLRQRFSVFQATSKKKYSFCRGAQLAVRHHSVLHPNENAISKWLNTVLAKGIIYP
ncbi:hypothetical protein H6H03_01455 [Nostoc paludosum FACHB-159]|uniref:Uncharacterized protein n=1 Tax=Nostoc paludosum FACHB-159 TaxID=2692908 RepID=A0ABR8K151_9NOSO|nr:hypothetical protein [Nostoc paludosum FACHB-159]